MYNILCNIYEKNLPPKYVSREVPLSKFVKRLCDSLDSIARKKSS
jgi:hypothetical protein